MGNRRGNSAATFFSPAFFNERFEPSTSASSFHVMSRGRSKFFPQSGMGSRPAPAVWGGKGKKRKSVESKSFRLTFGVFLQVPEHIVLLLFVRHCNLLLFWS